MLRVIMLASIVVCAIVLCGCGPNRTIPDRAQYQGVSAAPLSCVPNLDGVISSTELQAAVGIPVSYIVSPAGVARAINVAGQQTSQGKTSWDLGTDFAGDQVTQITAQLPTGKWYETSFPSAEFITALDLAGTLEAAYRHEDTGIQLLGYASKVENPPEGKTLVVYDSPIEVYRFPLSAGMQWTSLSEVRNATVQGLPYVGRDTYTVTVDASGELILPDVTFTQTLRVRTNVAVQPAIGASFTRKQVGWVFECFGEVARATSALNEAQADFPQAAEMRRLGF